MDYHNGTISAYTGLLRCHLHTIGCVLGNTDRRAFIQAISRSTTAMLGEGMLLVSSIVFRQLRAHLKDDSLWSVIRHKASGNFLFSGVTATMFKSGRLYLFVLNVQSRETTSGARFKSSIALGWAKKIELSRLQSSKVASKKNPSRSIRVHNASMTD